MNNLNELKLPNVQVIFGFKKKEAFSLLPFFAVVSAWIEWQDL